MNCESCPHYDSNTSKCLELEDMRELKDALLNACRAAVKNDFEWWNKCDEAIKKALGEK